MNVAPRPSAGLASGVSSYLLWGFIALYFKLVLDQGVAPAELLAHRVVWSFAFCVVLTFLLHRWRDAAAVMRMRGRVLALIASSILIAVNWLVFIYSVESHQLTQSALGYFINPLVSVLLGLMVLKERLRPAQWLSVALAASGVAAMIVARGQLPWIGLSVAISFGLYGLVRKMIAVGPLVGLMIETALLTPIGLAYILLFTSPQSLPASANLLLAAAGAVTAVPLLLFIHAAHNLRLSTLGFLQYIAPSCQFLIAIFLQHEPLSMAELLAFVPIWLALLVFSLESVHHSRRPTVAISPESPDNARPRASSSTVRAGDS